MRIQIAKLTTISRARHAADHLHLSTSIPQSIKTAASHGQLVICDGLAFYGYNIRLELTLGAL
jgi:hypothetical protein